ncbi:hypothetical protein TIFTF001_053041, partial [Ficus carica]
MIMICVADIKVVLAERKLTSYVYAVDIKVVLAERKLTSYVYAV